MDAHFRYLRSMRVLTGVFVGAALVSSGSALQALLRNPLADPYVTGVAGTAALGAALAVALGGTWIWLPQLAALVGSVAAALVLSTVALRKGPQTTLLLGTVVNAIAGAWITVLKTAVSAEKSQRLMYWLVGAINYPTPTELFFLAAATILGMVILYQQAPLLNLLSFGDEEAQRLGVHVGRVRLISYGAACLLVCATVPLVGLIGFLGLLLPHVLRHLVGGDLRIIFPVGAALGAATLALTDGLARFSFVWFASELPVGALAAIFGAPIFLWILWQQHDAG